MVSLQVVLRTEWFAKVSQSQFDSGFNFDYVILKGQYAKLTFELLHVKNVIPSSKA